MEKFEKILEPNAEWIKQQIEDKKKKIQDLENKLTSESQEEIEALGYEIAALNERLKILEN